MVDYFKSLFPTLSIELIQRIYGTSSKNYFDRGDKVIQVGQPVRSIVLVLKGRIKVYREDHHGKDFFIYYLKPGQACVYTLGHQSFSETSLVTAQAVEDTEAIMIPIAMANSWMHKYKCWNDFVLASFRQHLFHMMQVMDLLVFKSLDERLEHYLQAHKQYLNGSGLLMLSHQEVANDMGSSREVISRLLKKMESQGKVKLHRSQIELI